MYSKVILAQRYHTLNLVARSLKTKVPNEPRGCLTFNGSSERVLDNEVKPI